MPAVRTLHWGGRSVSNVHQRSLFVRRVLRASDGRNLPRALPTFVRLRMVVARCRAMVYGFTRSTASPDRRKYAEWRAMAQVTLALVRGREETCGQIGAQHKGIE